MKILLGIVAGLILGIPAAIGGTLTGISKSNDVGAHMDRGDYFIDDKEPLRFHVNRNDYHSTHS